MDSLDVLLARWLEAGLLDAATAERIRAFEEGASPERRLRWPALLALAFGALMLGGGLLLFVAAHWDGLSPTARFLTVLAKVAGLHLAGVYFSERSPKLATACHGLGTAALGAGIFLAGQIFNLQEHWPGGVLLWAVGAWAGWLLLRDWVQGTFAALLTPFWLAGEWVEANRATPWAVVDGAERVLTFAFLLLAFTYLAARRREGDSALRKALGWIGGLGLLPATFAAVATTWDHPWLQGTALAPSAAAVGWTIAFAAPLLLGVALRGREALPLLGAAAWAWLLGLMHQRELPLYAWCALGAVGLVAWGLQDGRRERVNLGVAGFALTLCAFYFSSVMDKLGRSLGLMGLGLLFLAGGWGLEQLRRNLNARIARGGEA